MKKLLSFRRLVSELQSGEISAGRSHFPHDVRGGHFLTSARPETSLDFGKMAECHAMQTFWSFGYSLHVLTH